MCFSQITQCISEIICLKSSVTSEAVAIGISKKNHSLFNTIVGRLVMIASFFFSSQMLCALCRSISQMRPVKTHLCSKWKRSWVILQIKWLLESFCKSTKVSFSCKATLWTRSKLKQFSNSTYCLFWKMCATVQGRQSGVVSSHLQKS